MKDSHTDFHSKDKNRNRLGFSEISRMRMFQTTYLTTKYYAYELLYL